MDYLLTSSTTETGGSLDIFFEQVCQLLNIHQSKTSAFHPQSDGQTERMNRTIEQVLRAHAAIGTEEWDTGLSMVEFAMNNSLHSSVKNTPFFLNTGLHPVTPIMLETLKEGKITCQASLDFATKRREALTAAMLELSKARDRYKSYTDSDRIDISFQIGDEVLLATTNINKRNPNHNRKLYPKWIGPYKVIDKINDVAYKLQLPTHFRIHNVFHVALLRKYKPGSKIPAPCPIDIDNEVEYEVETIKAHRHTSQKSNARQYLVKWKGYDADHCTWEKEANLRNAPDALADYWTLHNMQEKFLKERAKRPRVENPSDLEVKRSARARRR